MQPEDLVFYLDENICNCRPLTETLDRLGIRYERHVAHFPRGTPDEKWLPQVGQQGWLVLTVDQRIRYNPLEVQAIIRHGVREFVFTSGNLSGARMAEILEIAIPNIRKLWKKQRPPFVASITKLGAVNLRFDAHGPTHRKSQKS